MAPDELVDQIYEAAIVPERWEGVLASLTRLADGKDSLLALVRDGQFRTVSTSLSFEAMWREVLKVFPGTSNERTRRLIAANHAGFMVDSDVFEPDEMRSLPLYRDYMIPAGYGSACATSIPAPTGDVIIVHVESSQQAAPFRRDAVATLDAMRPHLARAGLLANRLASDRARAAAAALELVSLPAAVLGPRGRIMAANTPLVALMPDMVQDRPSRVALADGAADALLGAAVAQLGVGGEKFPVRSIPVRARGKAPPTIFHLIPICGAAHDVFAMASGVLIATPVAPRPALAAALVHGLFDLTPGEAKLAALIAAGDPPREAASKLGVTEETARTVLKRVFAKTGARRQAELVRLLAGSAAHAHVVSPD